MADFFPDNDDEPDEGWRKLDWKKPSKAVIANGPFGTGCVLWTVGPHVHSIIDEAGTDDLFNIDLGDAPRGISIWEGGIKSVHHNTPDANEHEWWLEGGFREPTPEEWESIRKGECPWNEDDWKVQP